MITLTFAASSEKQEPALCRAEIFALVLAKRLPGNDPGPEGQKEATYT
jgi:hypothetical protein